MGNLWYLERVNLFSIFCPRKYGEYSENNELINFKKGEFIYFSADHSNTVYLLAEGKVKILYYTEEGEEVIKSILSKGEVFGELALLGEEKRMDYAQSMQNNTSVCLITLDQMRNSMKEDTALALKINSLIGLKIQRLERKLELLVFKDVRSRLIEFLHDFAIEKGEQNGFSCTVRNFLTHKDIADLIGTTRQTVTTQLNDLRKQGMIDFSRRSFFIPDIRKLKIRKRDILRHAG